MAGWNEIAENFRSTAKADSGIIFGKICGSVWGKAGAIELQGDLKPFARLGKDLFETPAGTLINGKKFKYIRITEDNCIPMKFGSESALLVPFQAGQGPEAFILLYSEKEKPEQMINNAVNYASQFKG